MCSRRLPTGLGNEPGETLFLLGDTRDEFDGSIWAQVTADHLGGVPPTVDLAREKLLAEVLTAASRDGLASAAHDLSEGGLIQAVVEAALAGETGCRHRASREGVDPFVFLFSESAGRVLVAVPRTEESRFRSMCEARDLPVTRIGVSDTGSDSVEVQDLFTVVAGRAAHHLRESAARAFRMTSAVDDVTGEAQAPPERRRHRESWRPGRGAWFGWTSSASRSARCSSACR